MPVPRHALVLTAGLGTRLRPLTLTHAKPAIPVAGRPMIHRILEWLASHGVNRAVLNLHYLPETLTAVVGDGAEFGMQVRYSWEQPDILGSAGGVRRALPILADDADDADDTFLVVNGDTLTDADLEAMADAHDRSGALVTMALVRNREPERYGGVAIDEANRVTGFVSRGAQEPSYHFIGVQMAHASVFSALPDDRPASTVGGVYDDLIRRQPGAVRGWISDATFWDIGTPGDYWATTLALLPDTAAAGRRRPVDVGADGTDVARIERFLDHTRLAGPDARVVPLTGDASDRRYFRIMEDGKTFVLAVHAGPIAYATMPFANVANLLRRIPLPVPAILGHSDALGILALEDLGDVTLQAHLGSAAPGAHAALYREAVSLIELLQRRGREVASPGDLPYRIAFDADKLMWELRFFVRHFLEGYRGVTLSETEARALDAEWQAIASDLAGESRVLCHRDYHSRNLMCHAGRLYIIDFQDARQGPDTYDLVSLLRDSYVDIAEAELDDLIAYFLALKGDRDADGFRTRFDLMAVQRNLKALGTFGFQTTSRRNPVYLQYVPRTLQYVRANLRKHERFSRLRDILAVHIEELR